MSTTAIRPQAIKYPMRLPHRLAQRGDLIARLLQADALNQQISDEEQCLRTHWRLVPRRYDDMRLSVCEFSGEFADWLTNLIIA